MSKLVRDNTEEALENPRVVFKRLPSGVDLRPHLIAKLLEEAGELNLANDSDQALKELGDLQEVIWALADVWNIGQLDVHMQATGKRNARGRFTGAIMEVEEGPVPAYSPPPIGFPSEDGPWYSG